MFEESPTTTPDPRLGVFETMLVRKGEVLEAGRHLDRLAGSLERLYGAVRPAGLPAEVGSAAAGIELGRLRLSAAPTGSRIRIELATEALDPSIVFPRRGVALRTRTVAGGLGPDKLIDRPLGNRPATGAGALVVDQGEALEAAWANLFVVRGGVLRTPPADGRILPGVTRAAVIELAQELDLPVAEEAVPTADLPAAEEVFLTNSIRGVEPVAALDGTPLAGTGPLSRRLAAALRERWRLPARPDAPAEPAAAPPPDPPAR